MTLKEDVERQYEEMLPLAEQLDLCFEGKTEEIFGSRSLAVKEDAKERYWDTRKKLELQMAEWMKLLRKSLSDIPSSEKKFKTESRTNIETQDTYTVKEYENQNYASILDFFERLKNRVENRNGVLEGITESSSISRQLRNMRGDVLSFSNTLDLFVPEKMISIEKQVEITLRLRELGLEKVAEEIEGIEEEEDNMKKSLKARTALEQLVVDYCGKNGIEPTKGFHYNLAMAIGKGMTEKAQHKPISAHYSFVSKIIHKDIDADAKNTQFAIAGVINIIGSLTQKKA
jgi:hypothetical protein